MEDSPFLCAAIADEKRQSKEYQSLHVNNKFLNLEIYIWSNPNDGIDVKQLVRRITKLVIWIRQFPQSRYNPKQRWIIRAFLSHHAKRWCSSDTTLTPCHVNSGETNFTKHSIEILVFRIEDFFKVLVRSEENNTAL